MPAGRENQSLDSIVAIARDLFYVQGFSATSMQDIADAARIHKSSLYHHTSGKDALLEAICEGPLRQLTESLDEVESRSSSPGTQVSEAIAGAARAALLDPRSTSIIVRLEGKSPVIDRVGAWRRGYEQRLIRLIESAQASGEVRADIDPPLLARLVLGMINWIVQWFDPRSGPYDAATVEHAVSAMVGTGLFTEAPQ
jgi:AcrR family transcriptional regulator